MAPKDQDLSHTTADQLLRVTTAPSSSLGSTRMLYERHEDTADSGQALLESAACLQPVAGSYIAASAPEWVRMARLLSLLMEDAIATDDSRAEARSAIQRAWAAYRLGGYSARTIRAVSEVVSRAQSVLEQTSREDRESIVDDCTKILVQRLPPEIARYLPPERARAAVARLVGCADPKLAHVEVVSALLGWTNSAEAWASEAIAIALGDAGDRGPT